MTLVKHVLLGCIVAWLAFALGCEDPSFTASGPKPTTKKVVKKVVKKKKPKPAQPTEEELEIIKAKYEASRQPSRFTSTEENPAVEKITGAIDDSLELGPTLALWIVDRTASSRKLAMSATSAVKAYYDTEPIKQLSSAEGQPLLTAVVAFDENAEFLLDPPSANADEVRAALDRIQETNVGKENTFGAISQALEKYLSLRTDQRREIVLCVITDEAGDDPAQVDALIATTQKARLPVYVIGVPAPWGQVNPSNPDPRKPDAAKTDDSAPNYGPESLYSERVDIELRGLASMGGGGGGGNLDRIDSGFGPFHLERLCRASGGKFFAMRPGDESAFTYTGGYGGGSWPAGDELKFEGDDLKKYAPDYVSEAEYKQLLASNPARQALYAAAQMPKLVIDGSPQTSFGKAAEAQMKQNLDRAQQFAAKNAPVIDRLYEVLAPGEAGRDKLTSPRLQAEFDLAMGRVLSAKVRIDGYNSMIAALKRGKTFKNEGSSTWIIEPADSFETESTLKKMGEKAKMYLNRVVEQHPGTPWARIAEQELQSPFGWTWKEA
jgi:hypothetical protein